MSTEGSTRSSNTEPVHIRIIANLYSLYTDHEVTSLILVRIAEGNNHLAVHQREGCFVHDFRHRSPILLSSEGSVLNLQYVSLEGSTLPRRSRSRSKRTEEGQRSNRIPFERLELSSRNDELATLRSVIYIVTLYRYIRVSRSTIVNEELVCVGRFEGDDCAIEALTIQLTAVCFNASVVGSLSGQTGQVDRRLGNYDCSRVREVCIERVLNLPCLCFTCIPVQRSDRTITRGQDSSQTGRSRTSDGRQEGLNRTPITCSIFTTVSTYVSIVTCGRVEIREDIRSIRYVDQVREGIRIECRNRIQSDLPCVLTFLTCTPGQFSRVCKDIGSVQVGRFQTGQLLDGDVIHSSRSLRATRIIVSPEKNHFVETCLNSQVKRLRSP